MRPKSLFAQMLTVLLPLSASSQAMAQQVIGAKSGVIHYVEGDVFAADQKIETKLGAKFNELKPDQVLRAEEGRAEILLNPGVTLRLSESSSVKMINNKLSDTRLELVSGSALVEVAEMSDGNALSLSYNSHTISFTKNALVRIDSDPALVKVYQGEASVMHNGEMSVVKMGKSLSLDGSMQVARFDVKDTDAFYRWGNRRASYVSTANASTARSLLNSGRSMTSSGWYYNPYFGFATFIPMNGMARSPWGCNNNYSFGFSSYGMGNLTPGCNYYSPSRVYRYYSSIANRNMPVQGVRTNNPGAGFGNAGPTYNSTLGYNVESRASMSSSPVSSPSISSAPVSSPSVGRSDAGGASSGGAVSHSGGSSGRR